MNVLVAFASTEGQTQKIAHHIDAQLEAQGHTCTLDDCETSSATPDLGAFDAVIVAGSVHQQRHQRAISGFVETHLADLEKKPSGFISVSLSAALVDGQLEAQKYITEFSEETGWTPQHVHMAAGAIRFIEYDFFKTFTIQHIVMKGHDMPDKSAGNPEFTDWEALDAFVAEVLETAA